MNWELIQKLDSTDDDLWQNLVIIHLGQEVHPARKKGFCLARQALRVALAKVGHHLSISDLIIQDYSSVSILPEYTLSLSHTQEVGVALLAEIKKYRSVGIDVESAGRVVKPAILQRVQNQNDLLMDPLQLWCLKEASFKALINTKLFPAHPEFSSIQIQDQSFTHSPSGISGKWELQNTNSFVVALAWIDT